MAENLANAFGAGSSSQKSKIPLDYLDYSYIGKCTDLKLLGRILKVLKSGDEGFYPDLIKFCEKKIEEVDTAGAESKYLRQDKSVSHARDLGQEEFNNLTQDMKSWKDEMESKDSSLKTSQSMSADNLPPVRSGATIDTDSGQVTMKEKEPFHKPSPDRIRSGDYRSWDKYDADKEAEKIDVDASKGDSIGKSITADINISDRVNSTGMSDQEREVKANREKDKGNEAFRAGDFSEAEIYYSRSISLVQSVPAYNNRALARIRLEKFNEALADCNFVLEAEPDNVKGYMRRGAAKKGLKDFSSAKKDFQHVISLEPNNNRAKDLLADIATEEAKKSKATKSEKAKKGKRMVIEEVDGDDSSEDEIIDCTSVNRSEQIIQNGDIQKDVEENDKMMNSKVEQTPATCNAGKPSSEKEIWSEKDMNESQDNTSEATLESNHVNTGDNVDGMRHTKVAKQVNDTKSEKTEGSKNIAKTEEKPLSKEVLLAPKKRHNFSREERSGTSTTSTSSLAG